MVRIRYRDDRSAEQIISDVCECLGNMTGLIDRKLTLLDTAKHLIADYRMAHMNTGIDTPREFTLVIDLLDLIMSDSKRENDMLVDYKNDLNTAKSKLPSENNNTP